MKTQFAWHVHHDKLIEPLIGSIEERIAYIKKYKPEKERDLRLRLLKPVIGPLPIIYVKARGAYVKAMGAYVKARGAYEKAGEACVKAWKVCREAGETYYDEAWEAYDEARRVSKEAGEAFEEAGEAYEETRKAFVEARKVSQPIIELLHSAECRNCPWDGKTIFPPRWW